MQRWEYLMKARKKDRKSTKRKKREAGSKGK
jgi:hypothetical protein